MKSAIILGGSANSIMKQAEELKGYIFTCFPEDHEMEVWILSDQDFDTRAISFSCQIRSVNLVRVGTKHVAEEYLAAITELYQRRRVTIMIFGSDPFAAGIAVRAAYRFHGSSCVGVKSNKADEGHLIVEKMVYSNNLTAKLIMKASPFCISIAKGFRDKSGMSAELPAVEKRIYFPPINTDWLQSYQYQHTEAVDRLCSARIVVAVGKGVGSKEKMGLLEELTSLIGGKLGASRPVVMNAWTRMENLIGASGSILSPDVCIAIGVSGAAAFSAGIEKSKIIIAINKDNKAPIFKIADAAICSEYQEIVDELIKLLKSE